MKLSETLPFQGEKGLKGDTGPTGATGSQASTTNVGLIVGWPGTLGTIPDGWVLCDGTNGTPDLRDSFVKGAPNGADAGGTGGASTHSHDTHGAQTHSGMAVSNHPALTHSGFSVNNHENINKYCNPAFAVVIYHWTHTAYQHSDHAAVAHTISAQPSDHASQSHAAASNLPAYYALLFIMYVGA